MTQGGGGVRVNDRRVVECTKAGGGERGWGHGGVVVGSRKTKRKVEKPKGDSKGRGAGGRDGPETNGQDKSAEEGGQKDKGKKNRFENGVINGKKKQKQ